MSSQFKRLSVVVRPAMGILKPLRLRAAAGLPGAVEAARRPLVPTHVAGTANHLQHHVARHAQS